MIYQGKHLEIETKVLYHFAMFRRIIAYEWNVDQNGPQTNKFSRGIEKDNPIDLNKCFEIEVHSKPSEILV